MNAFNLTQKAQNSQNLQVASPLLAYRYTAATQLSPKRSFFRRRLLTVDLRQLKFQTLNFNHMKINWKEIIKLLITVLTAIAGTLGVMSCTM